MPEINVSPNDGIAVGAVPIAITRNELLVGLHCKTSKAPDEVKLGRVSEEDPLGMSRLLLRPSPFQLKKDKTVKNCTNGKIPVNSLVTFSEQTGPIEITKYDPAKVITLVKNTDKAGSRVEQVYFYRDTLENILNKGKSVFSDGGYLAMKVCNQKVYIHDIEIPQDLIQQWKESNDSQPANSKLNYVLSNNEVLNCTVPAAVLLEWLCRKNAREQIQKIFS